MPEPGRTPLRPADRRAAAPGEPSARRASLQFRTADPAGNSLSATRPCLPLRTRGSGPRCPVSASPGRAEGKLAVPANTGPGGRGHFLIAGPKAESPVFPVTVEEAAMGAAHVRRSQVQAWQAGSHGFLADGRNRHLTSIFRSVGREATTEHGITRTHTPCAISVSRPNWPSSRALKISF